MNLGKKISITLVIQIIGIASIAMANMIIAHRYGPKGHGYVNYIKSVIDLITGITLFGFPQSFIYMINSQLLSTKWIVNFSIYYGLACGFIILFLGSVFQVSGIASANGLQPTSLLIICGSSTGMIFYGLFRCVSLTKNSIYLYNLVTILPSLLAIFFYILSPNISYDEIIWIFLASTLISAIFTFIVVREKIVIPRYSDLAKEIEKIISSIHYGFWSFIPTISFNLVVSITYLVIRQGGNNEVNVGYFSAALLLLSSSVVPLNMVGPVLFDEWSKCEEKSRIHDPYAKLSHLGIIVLLTVLLVNTVAVTPMIILFFGIKYLPAVEATQVLFVSSYFLYQNRLTSSLLLAYGEHKSTAIASFIRTLAICLTITIFTPNSLVTVAWIWNTGEFITTAYMIWAVHKKTMWAPALIAGLSPQWIARFVKQNIKNI